MTLPDNYLAALRRLYSIEHKFNRDSAFAEKYAAVIDDYVSKGFAKPLKKSELAGTIEIGIFFIMESSIHKSQER